MLFGGLAQLARAPALHAGGHRFDSDILHQMGQKVLLGLLYAESVPCTQEAIAGRPLPLGSDILHLVCRLSHMGAI